MLQSEDPCQDGISQPRLGMQTYKGSDEAENLNHIFVTENVKNTIKLSGSFGLWLQRPFSLCKSQPLNLIFQFLGWIRSPRLRLRDFIQPKNCEIPIQAGIYSVKSHLQLVNDFIKSYISVLQLLTTCEIKKRGYFYVCFVSGLFLLIQGEVHSVFTAFYSHVCVVFTKSQT